MSKSVPTSLDAEARGRSERLTMDEKDEEPSPNTVVHEPEDGPHEPTTSKGSASSGPKLAPPDTAGPVGSADAFVASTEPVAASGAHDDESLPVASAADTVVHHTSGVDMADAYAHGAPMAEIAADDAEAAASTPASIVNITSVLDAQDVGPSGIDGTVAAIVSGEETSAPVEQAEVAEDKSEAAAEQLVSAAIASVMDDEGFHAAIVEQRTPDIGHDLLSKLASLTPEDEPAPALLNTEHLEVVSLPPDAIQQPAEPDRAPRVSILEGPVGVVPGGGWKRSGSHSSISSLATIESDGVESSAAVYAIAEREVRSPVAADGMLLSLMAQPETPAVMRMSSETGATSAFPYESLGVPIASSAAESFWDPVKPAAMPETSEMPAPTDAHPDPAATQGTGVIEDAAAAGTAAARESDPCGGQMFEGTTHSTIKPLHVASYVPADTGTPVPTGVAIASRSELGRALMAYGAILLDVRHEAERAAAPLPIATVSCPIGPAESSGYAELLAQAPKLLPRTNTPVVAFCDSGRRAAVAIAGLESLGYSKLVNGGGADNVLACLMAGA